MLVCQNLHKHYGPVHAVDGVSIEVGTGEVVGILGPNGAGKSTTIKMITGVLPPTRGSVLVNGHDTIDNAANARSCIGYLPEHAPLYPEMPVRSYLKYVGKLQGLAHRRRLGAVEESIQRCRLTGYERRPIGTLSKGYRQRVGLAAALLHNPPLLVLDEPTSGLDPAQIVQTRSLIADLAQDRTLLLVSHTLSEVAKTCSRIAVFARGKKIADAPPAQLTRAAAQSQVVVELKAEASLNAKQLLTGVAGVAFVNDPEAAGEGWLRYELTANDGADPRAAIAAACVAARVPIRALSTSEPSLEAAYLRLIQQAEEDAAETSEALRVEGTTS